MNEVSDYELLEAMNKQSPARGRSLQTEPETSLEPTAAKELYPGWIETYSGVQWCCADPRPGDVRLEDIFHGISLMCRFGGQVREYYTVGQHSIYVMGTLRLWWPSNFSLQLAGLMHDASEAYLSDIVRPLKMQMPQYLDIERKTMAAVHTACFMPPLTPFGESEVKRADNAVLAAEYRDLYPHSKLNWTLPEPAAPMTIHPISDSKYIENKLKDTYFYLKGQIDRERRAVS